MTINTELILRRAREISPTSWVYADGETRAEFKGYSFVIKEWTNEPLPYLKESAYNLRVIENNKVLAEIDSTNNPKVKDLYLNILAGKRAIDLKDRELGLTKLEQSLS